MLYYLDEYTFEWIIIHNWKRQNGNVQISSTGSSSTVSKTFPLGEDTSGTNNITRDPLVDLTTPYESNPSSTDNQKVTPQNRPARTYRLTMKDINPGSSGETNGGYFSLLKGKIIY